MAVYMIRAGVNGPMKIGKADDPMHRVRNLQCGCWERLSLVRVFEGDLDQERHLHVRFKDLHIMGDWFHFSRSMLDDVGLVEITKSMWFKSSKQEHSQDLWDRILVQIDAFLEESFMAETTFGLLSVNDGKIVSRLRAKKNITTAMVEKLMTFIRTYSAEAAA